MFLGGVVDRDLHHYSDDGAQLRQRDGRVTGLTEGTYSAHLKMTGRHTGRQDAELAL